jgi:hypothetical protein
MVEVETKIMGKSPHSIRTSSDTNFTWNQARVVCQLNVSFEYEAAFCYLPFVVGLSSSQGPVSLTVTDVRNWDWS